MRTKRKRADQELREAAHKPTIHEKLGRVRTRTTAPAEEDMGAAGERKMTEYMDAYMAGHEHAKLQETAASDMDSLIERLDRGITAESLAMDGLLKRIISRSPQARNPAS